ncbi:MAG: hypothetical protein Kow0092_37730 [Deferrisomatales bacterium]
MVDPTRGRGLATAAFFALGVIRGSNFLYMKLAPAWISPAQIVFFRVLFGFVPVLLYAPALATYQLGLALVLLAAVTPLGGIARLFADTRAAAGVVVGLGLLGTGVAYVLYYFLVDRLGGVAAMGCPGWWRGGWRC